LLNNTIDKQNSLTCQSLLDSPAIGSEWYVVNGRPRIHRIETAFAWLDSVAAEHANASRLLPKLDQAILAKAFRADEIKR
jgi:hypothetical protein